MSLCTETMISKKAKNLIVKYEHDSKNYEPGNTVGKMSADVNTYCDQHEIMA